MQTQKDNFKIVCCIDPDKTRLEEFSNKWSIENKFQYFDPDLINKFNCNLIV